MLFSTLILLHLAELAFTLRPRCAYITVFLEPLAHNVVGAPSVAAAVALGAVTVSLTSGQALPLRRTNVVVAASVQAFVVIITVVSVIFDSKHAILSYFADGVAAAEA